MARTDSHGATIPLFTDQYAHMFDRTILIDHEKLIGSSNVGVCADAHLSLPLPALYNIKLAASCRLCLVRRLGMHALARCALVFGKPFQCHYMVEEPNE